jgi:hypothetical protein
MLALLIARPSLTACTSFPIAALLALLASFSSEIHAQNSLNGSLPVAEAYPIAEESSANETSGHASSISIWDCFDFQAPFTAKMSDGSEMTFEVSLSELQNLVESEHPELQPDSWVYPLTIKYIDGHTEVITEESQLLERITNCFDQ